MNATTFGIEPAAIAPLDAKHEPKPSQEIHWGFFVPLNTVWTEAHFLFPCSSQEFSVSIPARGNIIPALPTSEESGQR